MPSLQALEAVPSFSSELAQAFGGGLSRGISSSINQMLQEKQQMKTGSAIAKYIGKPDMGSEIGQLPLEIQKELLKSYGAKQQEAQINRQSAQRAIGDMLQLLDKGNLGLTLKGLTPEGLGDRAAFDAMALELERLAADMVGKGTLNQMRFKFLKDRLPSSMKTDSQNRSMLEEWSKKLSEPESADETEEVSVKEKVLFDKANPKHKAKAQKLYKTLKDKEKVKKQLEREFRFDVG